MRELCRSIATVLIAVLAGSLIPGCGEDSQGGLGSRATGDIAYICTTEYFVCVVDRESGNEQLVTTQLSAVALAWSPTGTQLAIATPGIWEFGEARYLGGDDLYLVASDGSHELLISDLHRNTDPSWSPNGDQIAFTSDRNLERTTKTAGAAGSLYLLTLADRSIRRLTHGSDDRRSAWSPDGTEIAFVRGAKIWITSVDGSRSRRLPMSRPRLLTSVAWSPDGRELAVADSEGGIQVVGTDGRENRRLDFSPLHIDEVNGPSWSPDGRRLAFTGYDGGRCPAVFVAFADGKAARQVTPCNPDYDVADAPAWRPRG